MWRLERELAVVVCITRKERRRARRGALDGVRSGE
jgi:hypothetical protein